jgi:hypothetical protein
MGEVVRLPGGSVTLQAAVDAFLGDHELAPSTRRVYRASLVACDRFALAALQRAVGVRAEPDRSVK